MEEVVIKPQTGIKLVSFAELRRYKDLLYFLVVRGIKAKYAQSILGVGWAIFQPLIQTLVFTIIFGNLAKLDSDGKPYILFSFVAMVPWNFFSNILIDSTNSLIQNKNMLSKVYFPRVYLPVASVFSKALDFIIGLIVLGGMMIYFRVEVTEYMLVIPFLILILILTSLGFGLLLSALAIQYRDVNYAMSFLARILMYGAPVVYSINIIPKEYLYVYALNPMVGVIEGMRVAILQTGPFPWQIVFEAFGVSIFLFVTGLLFFGSMERKMADVA